MISKNKLKQIGSVTSICVGVIAICSAVVGGLSTYYGIPEIKSSVKKLEDKTDAMGKDVSEIKGIVKKYYTYEDQKYNNWIVTNLSTARQ